MITKKGSVTKISGDKTIKVYVVGSRLHPKYRKSYRWTKNYLAHDPELKARVGDEVLIEQCRPISARKHFILKSVLKSAAE